MIPPSKFFRETENCIRCGKPATIHCGHVRIQGARGRAGESINAGWCDDCRDKEKIPEYGFLGRWTETMGLRDIVTSSGKVPKNARLLTSRSRRYA